MSASASRAKSSSASRTRFRESSCATEIVGEPAERAFRRPRRRLGREGADGVLRHGHRDGGFENGVRDALSAVLASPNFLYRVEIGSGRRASDAQRSRARVAPLFLHLEQHAGRRVAGAGGAHGAERAEHARGQVSGCSPTSREVPRRRLRVRVAQPLAGSTRSCRIERMFPQASGVLDPRQCSGKSWAFRR